MNGLSLRSRTGTMVAGIAAPCATLSATLPRGQRVIPVLPWLAITMASASAASTVARIASASESSKRTSTVTVALVACSSANRCRVSSAASATVMASASTYSWSADRSHEFTLAFNTRGHTLGFDWRVVAGCPRHLIGILWGCSSTSLGTVTVNSPSARAALMPSGSNAPGKLTS